MTSSASRTAELGRCMFARMVCPELRASGVNERGPRLSASGALVATFHLRQRRSIAPQLFLKFLHLSAPLVARALRFAMQAAAVEAPAHLSASALSHRPTERMRRASFGLSQFRPQYCRRAALFRLGGSGDVCVCHSVGCAAKHPIGNTKAVATSRSASSHTINNTVYSTNGTMTPGPRASIQYTAKKEQDNEEDKGEY